MRVKARKKAEEIAEKVIKDLGMSNFTSPESSNVEGGVYDPLTLQAVISFRDKKVSGAPSLFYSYHNVLKNDWDELLAAESKGKHMRQVFSKMYKGKREE